MTIRTYADLQVYLESFIKPFSAIRSGDVAVTPLDRMKFLLEQLGNPHQKFRSVVVSGTSGKGSTAYLLSQMLHAAGYRVGLTISPHLQKINERLQINGQQIDDREFISLVCEIQPIVDNMKRTNLGDPSYYELLAAAAFLYFSRHLLDLVVVEVGIEAKYEASNLLSPLGVILTNISLDHTTILGNSVEQIAEEAVHSINGRVSDSFVVSGVEQPSVLKIVAARCLRKKMNLFLLNRDFSVVLNQTTLTGCIFSFCFGSLFFNDLHLSLLGDYQAINASLSLAAITLLQSHGFLVSEDAVRCALSAAFFSGRFELVSYRFQERTYTLVLDGAHNEAKMSCFIHSLGKLYSGKKKVFIVGFKKDKFIKKLLEEILFEADILIVTEFHANTDMAKSSAYSSSELADIVRSRSKIPVFVAPTSHEALQQALSLVEPDDLIVTTGSLYLVGEIRQYLLPALV